MGVLGRPIPQSVRHVDERVHAIVWHSFLLYSSVAVLYVVLFSHTDRKFKGDLWMCSRRPKHGGRNAQVSIKLKGQADYVRHIKYSF